jgi:hypothetical protein
MSKSSVIQRLLTSFLIQVSRVEREGRGRGEGRGEERGGDGVRVKEGRERRGEGGRSEAARSNTNRKA